MVPNPTDSNPTSPPDRMTNVCEELQFVLRVWNEKRTRLIQEVRELDRSISLLEHLNTNNRQLRTHIQSMNRRQRGESQPHRYKRVHSPTFSEGEEDGELTKM
uniref:Uncharacterized protein n=1 Tax=viral metagenome TaxID=1070528 RepID=A0A6C0IY20_9ZZZZ